MTTAFNWVAQPWFSFCSAVIELFFSFTLTFVESNVFVQRQFSCVCGYHFSSCVILRMICSLNLVSLFAVLHVVTAMMWNASASVPLLWSFAATRELKSFNFTTKLKHPEIRKVLNNPVRNHKFHCTLTSDILSTILGTTNLTRSSTCHRWTESTTWEERTRNGCQGMLFWSVDTSLMSALVQRDLNHREEKNRILEK